MEDIMVNAKEHKLLKKFQKQLEKRYSIKICMPKVSSVDADIVFVTVYGEKSSRDSIKKFLDEKMSMPAENTEYKENVLLVTLSDSEEEQSSEVDDSVCILDASSTEATKLENTLTTGSGVLEDSVLIIESPVSPENTSEAFRNVFIQKTNSPGKRKCWWKNKKTNKKVAKEIILCGESNSLFEESDRSIQKPANFIPLYGTAFPSQRNEAKNKLCNPSWEQCEIISDEIAVIEEPVSTLQPVAVIDKPVSTLRSLRPVVIDGSNVAREHGRAEECFSAKGIQLAIEYFLNRGHTQVTAFLPKYRKFHKPNSKHPTTDQAILDDLAKKQFIVFTPSRRVNGQSYSCYDDRFIVQLAVKNGGVIVSNDNYKDLIDESESFKETIEQRLLMYVFVGDVFMVPDDPLGRNGPKLNDFLCFPSES